MAEPVEDGLIVTGAPAREPVRARVMGRDFGFNFLGSAKPFSTLPDALQSWLLGPGVNGASTQIADAASKEWLHVKKRSTLFADAPQHVAAYVEADGYGDGDAATDTRLHPVALWGTALKDDNGIYFVGHHVFPTEAGPCLVGLWMVIDLQAYKAEYRAYRDGESA